MGVGALIYDFPDESGPIKQGDIFFGVPRVELSLQRLPGFDSQGPMLRDWRTIVADGQPVGVVAAVRPVTAIVATQDCDAARASYITLFEIRDFRDVEKKSKDLTSPKKWIEMITQQARMNQKWFYLPPDDRVGFPSRMGVDFLISLRVQREDLENLRALRRGRLNAVAMQHYRERIAEFFRRYAYDEWYPLLPNELEQYREKYPEADPFPWQRPDATGSSGPTDDPT